MSKALIAVRIERRRIAFVMFSGLSLDDTQVRYLPSEPNEAAKRAQGFMSWIASAYRANMVAFLKPASIDARCTMLSQALVETLRNEGIPVWEIERRYLYDAMAEPSIETLRELRDTARRIWPEIKGVSSAPLLEAASVGLLVQIERQYGGDG